MTSVNGLFTLAMRAWYTYICNMHAGHKRALNAYIKEGENMPRGGSKNGNNSPLIGENGVKATPAQLSALTHNMLDNFVSDIAAPPVDLHDRESVYNAIVGYFQDCERSGKRPGNMGMYRALGMSRQDVNNVLTGKSKSKLSPDCIDILKKACLILSEYREQLGSMGLLNPVTLIFWQKNHDNLEDATRLEIAADSNQDAHKTPDEIAKQIESDIPIDSVYHDID